MKSYVLFLIGLLALSSVGSMVASISEHEVEKGMQSLKLHTSELQISSDNSGEDEIDKFGERILSGELDKGEMDKIESNHLQKIMDWIQGNMYGGVVGFCGNNKFVKMAKSLAKNQAVELEFSIATVGTDLKPVKYISKIKVLNPQKVKVFLLKINDRAAEYNKKYPYRD